MSKVLLALRCESRVLAVQHRACRLGASKRFRERRPRRGRSQRSRDGQRGRHEQRDAHLQVCVSRLRRRHRPRRRMEPPEAALPPRSWHARSTLHVPAHTTSQNIDSSSGVSILAGLHYSVRHPWESEEDFLYERSKMSLTILTPSTRNSRLFSHTSSVCRTGRQPPTGWLVATAAAELFGPFLKTQTKKRRFLVIPLPHHARRVHVNWRESASRSSGQLFHG